MVTLALGNLQQTLPACILGTLLVAALSDARIEVVLHHPGVEPRDDIDRLRVGLRTAHVRCDRGCALCTLVVYRACGVELMEPGRHGSVVGAIATLVAEAPEDDAGVVLVALSHAYHAVHEGVVPVGCGSQCAPESVGLAVGLVHDVHAYGVAQLIPARTVGIVAETDGIDVGLLHQLKVLKHALLCHHTGGIGVVLMAVDTTNLDGLAVDEQLSVLDVDASETDLVRHLLDHGAIGTLQL